MILRFVLRHPFAGALLFSSGFAVGVALLCVLIIASIVKGLTR